MKILVAGGGGGGLATALKLADQGHQIHLFEARDALLSGSSNGTPCRLGLGFHYMDSETAFAYLKRTIDFVRRYPSYVLAHDKPRDDHLRRTDYYVVKDSLFPVGDIERHYMALKKEYQRLIKEDPANKVFGEVENFYRPRVVSDYIGKVNADHVLMGFDTAEGVLNWPKFKEDLIKKAESHENITLHMQTEVLGASQGQSLGYELRLKDKTTGETYTNRGDMVINALWENVEWLNASIGLSMLPESRTNRLKLMLRVKLPEGFEDARHMFFCFGPHCAFTNVGDGTGFITYEPVTNVEKSTSLVLPELSQRLLDGKITEEELEKMKVDLLAGVIEYVPGLQGAEIVEHRFGIVKTEGLVNIGSAASDVHKRSYSGVKERMLGWVDNSCMKLLYMIANADEVAGLIVKHILAFETLRWMVETLIVSSGDADCSVPNPANDPVRARVIGQAMIHYLQRYSDIDQLAEESDVSAVVTRHGGSEKVLSDPGAYAEYQAAGKVAERKKRELGQIQTNMLRKRVAFFGETRVEAAEKVLGFAWVAEADLLLPGRELTSSEVNLMRAQRSSSTVSERSDQSYASIGSALDSGCDVGTPPKWGISDAAHRASSLRNQLLEGSEQRETTDMCIRFN